MIRAPVGSLGNKQFNQNHQIHLCLSLFYHIPILRAKKNKMYYTPIHAVCCERVLVGTQQQMPSRDTRWVIISNSSEILRLYNLFCNIQHHHMPLLSEQLLVITSTFEPVGAIKQNLECDSLLISPPDRSACTWRSPGRGLFA